MDFWVSKGIRMIIYRCIKERPINGTSFYEEVNKQDLVQSGLLRYELVVKYVVIQWRLALSLHLCLNFVIL
jgi:hypothetical protein